MHLGIVSNCFRTQLESGTDLDSLVAESVARGYRAIELRQSCLGRYESDDEHMPDAAALAGLAERFPSVRFNLAIAFAFLDPDTTASEPLFLAGFEAAKALAGRHVAHLRLVDLFCAADQVASRSADEIAQSLVRLASPLAELGGILSLENCREPWGLLLAALRLARRSLGDRAGALRLCFDACNLLRAADHPLLGEATAGLAADELSMVHFKQAWGGRPQPTVGDGDVDWRVQLSALHAIGYSGPCLFEIEPHEAIWEHLDSSVAYLRTAGLGVTE